jgi:hypothetical protein
VVQSNTIKSETHAMENVDWSPTGPWAKHWRIFGLSEFAGVVTSLAMQKQSTDIRKRILPHHVFQLQCIVDSLMVTRGWSLSRSRGHAFKPPPENFRSRRDVDLFLDRKNERPGHGILQPLGILKQLCVKNVANHNQTLPKQGIEAILDRLRREFSHWLPGDSRNRVGIPGIPPSRFSSTNENGLWVYSPFLCGTGLMESLELTYLAGMGIWERIPEPMLLIHLHNMLVKKAYLKKPDSLFQSLERLFAQGFFIGGKVPSSKFWDALQARLQALVSATRKILPFAQLQLMTQQARASSSPEVLPPENPVRVPGVGLAP